MKLNWFAKTSTLIWLGIIGAVILFLLALGLSKAFAGENHDNGGPPRVTICHVPEGNTDNQRTLRLPLPAALAHLRNHEFDYRGPCREPEPTPPPNGDGENGNGEEEVVESAPQPSFSDPSPAGPPVYPPCPEVKYAPTVTNVGRLDADTVFAHWTKIDEGINLYRVDYGLSQNSLPWSTIVEGNYTELNGVPNTHIFLKVAGLTAKEGGCLGNFGTTVDP